MAIDWTRLSSKVDQVTAAVNGSVTYILTTAKEDNRAVGDSIELKLNFPIIQAQVVMEQAQVAIKAQTLTEAQARGHFAELDQILTSAEADISPDLDRLSETVAASIRDILAYTRTQVARLASEIYAILNDDGEGTPGVDWTKVDAKVVELRTVIKDTSTQAGDAAYNDNPVTGSIIRVQLQAAEGVGHSNIARLKEGIRNQNLGQNEATYFLSQIQAAGNRTREEIKPDLALLSQTAQTTIETILANGDSEGVLKGDELKAMLPV